MIEGLDARSTDQPGEHLLRELKWVHAAIRHDLEVCRELADQVAAGAAPEQVTAHIESLQTRGPLWKLRSTCLYHCRLVHAHHGAEDVMLFPTLRRSNPALGPVVDRLESDHRTVSDLLDEVEAAARSLASGDDAPARGRIVAALGALSTHLLAHLEYEEEAITPTLRAWTEWPM